ncbi:hypothetical protein PAXRUDRAFT_422614 [Paxillus rubicundulus Ve08.2h10]|uniref:Uncharacterized protein n=1 Tax=Paxillus rubicundulus Ve08.2h10 TaxID=930991 RepID=A0A0D0E2J3_9AGAM|nr:hypothetical protein PAXRUDRAFT_422614 [Paxillus rubicundulus Ve08.2h10]
MSPRRMDISSLLCKYDSSNKQNTLPLLSQPPLSPPLNDPVILAPHLRGRHTQNHQLPPPSVTTTTAYNHTLDDRQVLPQPAPTLRQTASVDHLPSPSTKFLHMSQHNLEHASLPPEFTRQSSSSLASPAYTEKPRTIDSLLHHPPAYTRPSAPSQMSPSEHYSRPSSSHSPTSVISLLNHPVQYPPGSQSPSSSVASYSPTASRDTRQETIALNTNVSPGHSAHRSTESPIAAYQPSRPPTSTSRPSPLTLPHTFPRSAPDVLHLSQHRALSSTFSHPYSPTEVAQQRDASGPDYMSTSASVSASPPVAYVTSSSAPASVQAKLRSPFLGLEALVHVASEERRRISGGSDVSSKSTGGGLGEWNREKELARENGFVRERERDRDDEDYAHAHRSTNPNPSPVHDREMPSRSTRHYGYPITHVPVGASYSVASGMHSYPQLQLQLESHPHSHRSSHPSQMSPLHQSPSMSYEDEARPHKRHRESRSPSLSRSRSRSPGARIAAKRVSSRGELTSPRVRRAAEIRSTDHHRNRANVTDNYPTARQHAHQPCQHVEPPSSLAPIAPVPGMLVAGIDDRVGPAPMSTPFPPPLSGSYAASHPAGHMTPAPLQPASPRAPSYVHHPIQVSPPSHYSFPHNQSPHQHSPQHFHPQLHHSQGQSQTASPHSAALLPALLPTTIQSMPPSYAHGSKTAGGAGVLRPDSPPRREVLRPESTPREAVTYEGPRHGASREQPKYESMSQESCELSIRAPLQAPVPRLARAVWDDEDDGMGMMDVQAPLDDDKSWERVVPRKQLQLLHPQPLTSPHVHPERPNKRKSEDHEAILVKKVEVPSEHKHQPMRVWEETALAPRAPRRVSPTPILYAASSQNISEGSARQEVLGETKRGHDEQLVVEYQVKDEVADKSVSPPSLSPTRSISPSLAPIIACSPAPPVHHTRLEPYPPRSELSPSAPVFHPEAQPMSPVQSHSPIKSEPRASALPPKFSTPECSPHPPDPPAPVPAASPILDLQSEHLGPEPEPEPEPEPGRSSTVRSGPDISRSPSHECKPIESEPTLKGKPVPEVGVMHDAIMSDGPIQEPSPEHVQPPTLTQGPWPSGTPEVQPKLECFHGQSWIPPQLPLPVPSPVKEEPNSLPDGIPINHPKSSPRQPPKSERSAEQQQAVTNSPMMDVDEELLSLVEDHVPSPAAVLPVKPNGQARSKSATPFAVGGSTGGGGDQGSSGLADGSSSSMPSQPLPKVPAIIGDQEKDRASMPPPAPPTKKADKVEKEKGTLVAGDATGSKKKKEGTSKVRFQLIHTRAIFIYLFLFREAPRQV